MMKIFDTNTLEWIENNDDAKKKYFFSVNNKYLYVHKFIGTSVRRRPLTYFCDHRIAFAGSDYIVDKELMSPMYPTQLEEYVGKDNCRIVATATHKYCVLRIKDKFYIFPNKGENVFFVADTKEDAEVIVSYECY